MPSSNGRTRVREWRQEVVAHRRNCHAGSTLGGFSCILEGLHPLLDIEICFYVRGEDIDFSNYGAVAQPLTKDLLATTRDINSNLSPPYTDLKNRAYALGYIKPTLSEVHQHPIGTIGSMKGQAFHINGFSDALRFEIIQLNVVAYGLPHDDLDVDSARICARVAARPKIPLCDATWQELTRRLRVWEYSPAVPPEYAN